MAMPPMVVSMFLPMIVFSRQLFTSKTPEVLIDGIVIVIVCFSFHHGDGVQRAGAQTCTQAVTVDIADELRLAIYDLQSTLSAVGYTQSAPITLVFVYMNHRS
jgi:hypothetical protein